MGAFTGRLTQTLGAYTMVMAKQYTIPHRQQTISDVLGNSLLIHIESTPSPQGFAYHLPGGAETQDRKAAKGAWMDEAVRDANKLFALTRMPNENYADLIRLRHRAENDMRNLFDTVYPNDRPGG